MRCLRFRNLVTLAEDFVDFFFLATEDIFPKHIFEAL